MMRTFTKVLICALLVTSLSGYLTQLQLANAQVSSVPAIETTVTDQPTSTATPTATPTVTSTVTPTITPLPPLVSDKWISFYGRAIQLDNRPVPSGKTIEAYDSNGRLCGVYRVDTTGKYGFLTCALDDPDTLDDEGVASGETIYFKVDGQTAGTFQLPDQLKSGARFNATPVMVPEPVTIILFGTGLLGLAVRLRRRGKQSADVTTLSVHSRKGDQP